MSNTIYLAYPNPSPLGNYVDLVSATSGSIVLSMTGNIFIGDSYKLNYAPALRSPGAGLVGMCIFQFKCFLHQLNPFKWPHTYDTRGTFGQCVIKLGSSSTIRGFRIETHFCWSVEGTFSSSIDNLDKAKWVEILPKVQLSDSHNELVLDKETDVFTHIRFSEYACNDVINFSVYGQPCI